jgi:hypothetical protein
MFHTKLVMPMRLLQEAQVSAIPILTLPLLDLTLHDRKVTAEAEALAITEPDIVVGLAFPQFYAFSIEARS